MPTHIRVETVTLTAVEAEQPFLELEIEIASREQLTELQEKRILELMPYAWERSGCYRELWSGAGVKPEDIRSLDDFIAKVPTFCKDDIKAYRARTGDPFGGLLRVDVSEPTSIMLDLELGGE